MIRPPDVQLPFAKFFGYPCSEVDEDGATLVAEKRGC